MEQDACDPFAILKMLGITTTCTVHPVKGTTDSMVWKVKHAEQIYALRVFQKGRHEMWERECIVMQDAYAAGLPVPQIFAQGIWHDYPAMLIAWVRGRTVYDEINARPWRTWRLGMLFGRMQAAIHALSAPDLLQQNPTAWITSLGAMDFLLQQRLLAKTGQQQTALLHLDYHPLNVLTDGKRITGVIDWSNACAGDTRADAARTIAILRADFGVQRRFYLLERGIRLLFEWGWRTGYQQSSGPLGDLRLFYAWAGTAMEKNLVSKRSPADLKLIHRWTLQWTKQLEKL